MKAECLNFIINYNVLIHIQYDENGKLRSYSNLSTGESELHNVNGKVAGYKAATTTVEDNGRTSTYSIHT